MNKYKLAFIILCFYVSGILTGLIYWNIVYHNYVNYLLEQVENCKVIFP